MPEALSPDNKVITPKTADAINDMFNELDDKQAPPEEKKEVKTKEVEEKEIKEPEDEELELKEPEDEEELEKLDLKEDTVDIEAPPRKKEILAKYPDLFKSFPFLEKMMYRDRQYNEMFGSFDDAKEVAERAESFASFETQLLAGDTKEILREVKNSDERAFNIIVDEYLPALAAVDKDAYFQVVGNLNKRLIMEMMEEAKNSENENLKEAALLVHQFIFGNSKFTPPTLRVDKSKTDSTERSEVEKERLEFLRERFETAINELQTKADNTLRATISDYIDPRSQMTSYIKKNAINDAMKIVSEAITADSATVKNLDKLWRQATESKFSKDSLGKIQSFYLSRAKSHLKSAILKARAEALKDTSPKREKEEEIEEETPRRSRIISPGRPSQSKGKNDGPRKGESIQDYFNRD